MNALVHRDYESIGPTRFTVFSDRIEIINPVGLVGGLSRAEFPARNLYRNPILAECMKAHGFCNRFGYGIVRAQRMLQENGSNRAEFDISDAFFAVTIRRKPRW